MDIYKFIRTVLGVVLLTVFPIVSTAQGINSIWYFGGNAGVDFNSTSPIAVYDGMIVSDEGCATYTDDLGNLIMYTNGVNVYNRIHQQMPNGFGLAGHMSSSQSAIIVPKPNADSIYYVFTTSIGAQGVFAYSIVDLRLDNGLGDVIVKNQIVQQPVVEQLAAVRHANGSDFWIVVRANYSNALSAYLLTSNGLSLNPVISNAGPVTSTAGSLMGYLKSSHDGEKIAFPINLLTQPHSIILCDFNAATGEISNDLLLPVSPARNPYGIEFSPNGHFLYTSQEYQDNTSSIFQWNIASNNLSSIIASRQLIFQTTNPYIDRFGALQLGPDSRIYIARGWANYISKIDSPNLAGALCDYIDFAIDLSPAQSRRGFPTSVQFVPNNISIQAQVFCIGNQTQFSAHFSDSLINYQWNFGDQASGASNTSTLPTPFHIFSSPGQFTVSLTATTPSDTFTQTLIVEIISPPANTILPPGPLEFCSDTTQILHAAALPNLSYQWLQNGQPLANDTLPALTVSTSGFYQVLVSDRGCPALSDSVQVTVHPQAIAQISPASPPPVCFGQTIPLSAAQSTGNTFAWLLNGQAILGANGPVFDASSSGNYQVIVSSNGYCADTSGITVVEILASPIATVSPVGPLSFCSGDSALLTAASVTGATYQWLKNNEAVLGAVAPVFAATSPGSYQVIVTSANSCSDTSAIVTVSVNPLPQVTPAAATGFCPGSAVTIQAAANPGAAYQWLINGEPVLGATTREITLSSPGQYQYIVSTAHNCTDTSGILTVTEHPAQVQIVQEGEVSCTDPVTLTATGADSYVWSTGATSPSIIINPGAGGFYAVTGQNQFGCEASDSVNIPIPGCMPVISVPNIITPNNDGVNDVFLLTIEGQEYDLQIFNRWGAIVFERKQYNRQQDWRADGLPDGVYFYSIGTTNGQVYKGWVEVIR